MQPGESASGPVEIIEIVEIATRLAGIGREFHRRGWVLGTSGNFSVVLRREPLYLLITRSGVDKGALATTDFLRVDCDGAPIDGAERPSAETALHLAVARLRGAGAVLHTHSVWSTILSDACAAHGGLAIEGYEMLKGLAGVQTHKHREWLPVLENSQDWAVDVSAVEATLARQQDAHGFLLRGHGLYTWGETLAEAKRHTEILEFLLEVMGRRH